MKEIRRKISNNLFILSGLVAVAWIVWAGIIFFNSKPGSWKIAGIGLLVQLILGILGTLFNPDPPNSPKASREKIDKMNGLDFEHYCAEQLKKTGRYKKVEVTQASGDFGADIVAIDKKGDTWVFQCKRYSSRLDNTPVQEIVAAKAHYNAKYAAVITNSSFTKPAKQLAAENAVKLVEGDDLDRFIEYDEIFD